MKQWMRWTAALGVELRIVPLEFSAVLAGILEGGVIREQGTPEQVFQNARDPRTAEFLRMVL